MSIGGRGKGEILGNPFGFGGGRKSSLSKIFVLIVVVRCIYHSTTMVCLWSHGVLSSEFAIISCGMLIFLDVKRYRARRTGDADVPSAFFCVTV